MVQETGFRTQRRGKFDKAMYFRRPQTTVQRKGWIVTASRTHRDTYELMGFEPLMKYGVLPNDDPELRNEEGKPVPLRSPWYPILTHPDGPKEFPVAQVMTFRWYVPEECPNPKAKFPQLQGHKVTHYPCPECERPAFIAIDGLGGIEHLARHLRIVHDWDRPSLMKYGEKVGLDFDVVYGDLKKTYDFSLESEVEVLSCDECDFVVREDSKDKQASLRFHKMKAHKPLEVETVSA